jgi:SOS-response transcriptional repressor LexA
MHKSEKFSDRLIRWRATHELTQPDAATLLGVGRTYISQLENRREPGATTLARFEYLSQMSTQSLRAILADTTGTPQFVAAGTGLLRETGVGEAAPLPSGKPGKMIPRIGWAQAGAAMVDFADVVQWEDFVTVPTDDPKAIAITVRGESMSPEIVDGDIVVVAPSHPPITGKPVVARTTQGVMLKKYHRTRDGYELRSVHPDHPPIPVRNEDVHWIYPVTAVIHFT